MRAASAATRIRAESLIADTALNTPSTAARRSAEYRRARAQVSSNVRRPKRFFIHEEPLRRLLGPNAARALGRAVRGFSSIAGAGGSSGCRQTRVAARSSSLCIVWDPIVETQFIQKTHHSRDAPFPRDAPFRGGFPSQSQGARIASFAQDSTGSPALVSSLGGMIGMPCSPRRVVFHALAATHACHAACNMQPHCNGRPPDGCGLSRARPLRHAPAGDRRRDATSLTAICQIRCMSSAAARPM